MLYYFIKYKNKKYKNKIFKAFSLLILISLMAVTLTACDLLNFFTRQYNAEIFISGLETPEHHSIFTITNDYNDEIMDWPEEEDVEGGTLSGTLAGIRGEVVIGLSIDNQKISGHYTAESYSKVVDIENNQAEFYVEFDYEPAVAEIKLSGPEKIYPARGQGDTVEYEYSADIFDQAGNLMEDEEVEWGLKDKPAGVTLVDGVLKVSWDTEPGNFEIKASSQDEADIFAKKMVEIKYLPEEEEVIYQRAFDELDNIIEKLNLEHITEDFELPEMLKGIKGDNGKEFDFEIIWSADRHDAIEIENNRALVTFNEDDDIEGYITAFIQPANNFEVAGADNDPRQKNYPAVVSKSILLKTIIEFEHNFPASRVDNFYSLKEQKLASFRPEEITLSSAEINQESEEIIVGINSQINIKDAVNYLEKLNYEVIDSNEILNAVLIKLPEGKALTKGVWELSGLPDVRYAEANSPYHLLNVRHPDDDYYSYQWHFPQIRLPQAWDVTTGSNSISVAVLDTGVNTGHPDLGEQIDEESGYNFVDNNYNFSDNHGHGTHVAGTIAANSNNTIGVAGILWDGRIIPVKVLNDNGTGYPWRIANGILYAAGLKGVNGGDPLSEPADIINMSFGSIHVNSVLRDAVQEAVEENIIIIAAAGNDGDERLVNPAAFPEVISVGAVDFNYPGEPELTYYSNFSAELDILAPGGNLKIDSDNSGSEDGVMSTGIDNNKEFTYVLMNGTSMAASHVSGVAGLMLSQGISPAEVRDTLRNTAMNLASFDYDAGLVNAYWAVNQIKSIELHLYQEENEDFIKIDSKDISINERAAEFVITETGNYLVEAIVDVRKTGKVDPGDYKGSASLKEANMISGNVEEVTITLKEEY